MLFHGVVTAFILVLAAVAVRGTNAQPVCGYQAKNAYCEPGYCCNRYGFCGTTAGYCGAGCQSQCKGEICGSQANNAVCPSPYCCSQDGFCGMDQTFCGTGCQSGPCTASKIKLGYWRVGSMPASSISSCLFTHIVYSFVQMNSTDYVVRANNVTAISTFVTSIRKKNPSVKTILGIGGGTADRDAFAKMVSFSSYRSSFISTSISLARRYNFDGLDLNWNYPNTSTHMTGFGLLLQEWRASAGGLLLSATVYYTNPQAAWMGGQSYPVSAIKSSLDWILLMSYDFHGPSWESFTNVHAPLYDPNSFYSADYGTRQWLLYMYAGKLLLGLPTYGYSWQLLNASNHGIGAAANGSDDVLTETSYSTITAWLSSSGATVVQNSTTESVYAYKDTTWVAYDDPSTITTKVNYVVGKSLRGYGFWELAADDSSFTLAKSGANAMDGKYCNV